MGRAREFLQKNPAAGYGIAVLFIALAAYMLYGQFTGGGGGAPTGQQQPPAAPPAAGPVPAPAPTAESAAPAPAASAAVVPPGPMGRTDPFVPLVVPASASPSKPPAPASPLPPPPFPTPGSPLPPPPLPGAPGTPAPAPAPSPPAPSAGINVSGIVSDQAKVVIVSIGGRTEILFEGESAGDLRVVKIDANRRTVTFERAGQRFDVTMGGG
ncbi:MAG TPA: hypothetical protein VI007_01110 [bacterium]